MLAPPHFLDDFLIDLSSGDPHMTGFLGQKFDFTGEDGQWYCLIADENMNVNMRVTSPVADLPEITYITGMDTRPSIFWCFVHFWVFLGTHREQRLLR